MGRGIVSWFLSRKIVTLKEAQEQEVGGNGRIGDVISVLMRR